jgi:Ca2+-binding EF-hand superfamily protein
MSKSPLKAVTISYIQPSKSPPPPPAFDPNLYATKNLPADDVIKLKECFDIFDYDKSGNISPE